MRFVCTKCNNIVPTINGYWESMIKEIEPQCSNCLHDKVILDKIPPVKELMENEILNGITFKLNEIMNYKYLEQDIPAGIIMVNKYFYDDRPTFFKSKINQKEKTTIIKPNYKKYFDLIVNNNGILSLREWSKVPKKSKINHIATVLNPGIQKIVFEQEKGFTPKLVFEGNILSKEDITLLANNNGMTYDQFFKYFKLDHENNITKKYSHAILHLNYFHYKYTDKLIYEKYKFKTKEAINTLQQA